MGSKLYEHRTLSRVPWSQIKTRITFIPNTGQKHWRLGRYGFDRVARMASGTGNKARQTRCYRSTRSATGDIETPLILGQCRSGISLDESQCQITLGRRSATYPLGNTNWFAIGQRTLYPRRTLYRASPARQPTPYRKSEATARPRQQHHRR